MITENFSCKDLDNEEDIKKGIEDYLAIVALLKKLNEQKKEAIQNLLDLGDFSCDINKNLRVYTGHKKKNQIDREGVFDFINLHPDARKYFSKNALLAGALKADPNTQSYVVEIIEETVEIKTADPEAIDQFIFYKEKAAEAKQANG